MLLQEYIKQVLIEVISKTLQDASYKQHIKSLFESWINKFIASYLAYRKQNHPVAWPISSVSCAEDFEHQYIKLLLKEKKHSDYALIFEHEGSVYIINDRGTLSIAFSSTLAFPLTHINIAYWHKHNYLFKLSISDFETALGVADNYDEFMALCEQMNEKSLNESNESNRQYSSMSTEITRYGEKFVAFYQEAKSSQGLSELNQLARKHFGVPLGAGSFRTAYSINKDYVIKVVATRSGIDDNKNEANNEIMTTFPDLLPKVEMRANDYSWIIMERLNVIDESSQFNKFFPEFDMLNINEYAKSIFVNVYLDIKIDLFNYRNNFVDNGKLSYAIVLSKIDEEGILPFIKHIKPNLLLSRLLQLCIAFDVRASEIRIGNVGITRDNKFKLLDLSMVHKLYKNL